tara:strand:+ start:2380 stop:3432 length:1053 start_codon:yes stop_codon:yes gene_type:complete
MKNIVVTGGCGFIGSNFIFDQLNNYNSNIINIDSLTYSSNKQSDDLFKKTSRYSFIEGDIVDYKLILSVFKKFKPDLIINFAAETHVDRSIEEPDEFLKTNLLGTLNLLKIALSYFQENNSFRFIQISTDEVFGSLSPNDKAFTESHPYRPNSPYSASKAGADHLVRSFNKTYKLPTIITNCSNNYGPFQFPEKLIPLMIANSLDEKQLPVYGDGKNIRDWLHVKDHCNALGLIINSGKFGETYNIGSSNEIKNIDIIKNICGYLDHKRPRKNKKSYKDLITFVEDRPGHDLRYSIDSSKIINELNWKSEIPFKTGLIETVNWYLENEDWWRNIQKMHYNQERLGLNHNF